MARADRSGGDPVPHLEREQGARGARHACTGGPAALQARDSPHARIAAAFGAVSAGSGGFDSGGRSCGRRRHLRAASSFARAPIVLTAGTFLGGKIHVGLESHPGGRAGDPPSTSLAVRLRELPLRVGRLKTGTPPRIDGRSIDFSALREQHSDDPRPVFSYLGTRARASAPAPLPHHRDQRAHSRHHSRGHRPLAAVHRFDRRRRPALLPLGGGQSGAIRATSTRTRSSSSPKAWTRMRSIPTASPPACPSMCNRNSCARIAGFENAHITRPGYAIEYDFFDPRDLKYSLESKFLAGSVFRRPDQRHHRL